MNEVSPETKIALQEKDIAFANRNIADLKKTVEEGFKAQREDMKWMRDNAVLQVNFEREIKNMRGEFEEEVKRLEEAIKCKADQKDFQKLSDNVGKLIWAFVTPLCAAAIGGLVFLIGKFSGGK